LNEEDRELVRLRFTESQGQEETAKALGSTRMKVRTQESRIRRRLVAFLRHSGYLDEYMNARQQGEEETSLATPGKADSGV